MKLLVKKLVVRSHKYSKYDRKLYGLFIATGILDVHGFVYTKEYEIEDELSRYGVGSPAGVVELPGGAFEVVPAPPADRNSFKIIGL